MTTKASASLTLAGFGRRHVNASRGVAATTQLRAVRDVPAPPSSRYLDALYRVGTCETRAQDDDRRASASGAGPPRGFAASCATRSLGFSETRSRNARAWTLPSRGRGARARAPLPAARAESAASAANASSSARRVDEPVSAATDTRDEQTKGVRLGHGSDDADSFSSSSARDDSHTKKLFRGFTTFEDIPSGAVAICVTSGVLMAGHACVAPALPASPRRSGRAPRSRGVPQRVALARLVERAQRCVRGRQRKTAVTRRRSVDHGGGQLCALASSFGTPFSPFRRGR